MRRKESVVTQRERTEFAIPDFEAALDKQIEKAQKKKDWRKFVLQTICAIVAVFLLLTQVIGIVVVHGDSMNPSLQEGDIVLIWRLGRQYVPGDIILFASESSSENLIKRVVAVPGDDVEIGTHESFVIVNNAILEEAYADGETYAAEGQVQYPLTVEENTYFVLGDNRRGALDSRHSSVGLVDEGSIYGKVILLFRAGGS